MESIESEQKGVMVVEPRGRIDTVGAKPFGDKLTQLIGAGSRRMIIDLRHVQYVSSAGFRVFLVVAQQIEDARGNLVLCRTSAELRRLFETGKFTELFTVAASREEGLANAAA